MRRDFKQIDFRSPLKTGYGPGKHGPGSSAPVWMTAEQIPVKPRYTADDLGGMEHLGYAAGIPPSSVVLTRQCTP